MPRTVYDLTDPDDAYRYLEEEAPHRGQGGWRHLHAARLEVVAELASPDRNPGAERPTGEEAMAALSVLRGLRAWLDESEPRLTAAARDAGVTWDTLAGALGVGDRRAAHRRHTRRAAAQTHTERVARIAQLPADTRPEPRVDHYDNLLIRRPPFVAFPSPTTVVNMRGHRDDPAYADVVYVGDRCTTGGWRLDQHPLHNPYKLDRPGKPRDGDRATVVAKYRTHLLGRPDLLALLPALRGCRLACWCHPLPCHAHVIAELADRTGSSSTDVTTPL